MDFSATVASTLATETWHTQSLGIPQISSKPQTPGHTRGLSGSACFFSERPLLVAHRYPQLPESRERELNNLAEILPEGKHRLYEMLFSHSKRVWSSSNTCVNMITQTRTWVFVYLSVCVLSCVWAGSIAQRVKSKVALQNPWLLIRKNQTGCIWKEEKRRWSKSLSSRCHAWPVPTLTKPHTNTKSTGDLMFCFFYDWENMEKNWYLWAGMRTCIHRCRTSSSCPPQLWRASPTAPLGKWDPKIRNPRKATAELELFDSRPDMQASRLRRWLSCMGPRAGPWPSDTSRHLPWKI